MLPSAVFLHLIGFSVKLRLFDSFGTPIMRKCAMGRWQLSISTIPIHFLELLESCAPNTLISGISTFPVGTSREAS